VCAGTEVVSCYSDQNTCNCCYSHEGTCLPSYMLDSI